MAIISPFRAWRYDPEHVPLQQAVTQPYDKITPPMQEAYYNASPYNLVRIILGKRQPDDGTTDNVYLRAASSFQNWRQTGVLRRDPAPEARQARAANHVAENGRARFFPPDAGRS